MLVSGNLTQMARDFKTGDLTITFTLNDMDEKKLGALASLIDKGVDLRVETHRDRRSRNSNAYFHVLVNKLAGALTISKAYAKNLLITRYGQPETDESGEPIIWKTAFTPEIVRELETPHAIACGSDGDFTLYRLYRGCHTYNTKEMSELIEGTLSELAEMGIPEE